MTGILVVTDEDEKKEYESVHVMIEEVVVHVMIEVATGEIEGDTSKRDTHSRNDWECGECGNSKLLIQNRGVSVWCLKGRKGRGPL